MEKSATCTIEKNEGVGHYAIIPADIAAAFLSNGYKRLLCQVNNQEVLHMAIMHNKVAGFHYIYLGNAFLKKMKLQAGSQVDISFAPDETPYQFDMPAALEEVLNTDEAAHRAFHALTEGNQRGLIQLIRQVKSEEKQVERALRMAENLKLGIRSPRDILRK